MHLTSSINPDYKGGTIPVAIFCFGEQRKFIRVSEGYQDTLRRVHRAFKITEDVEILFQTSTLEVCKGQDTVIDESAYPLMWNALDEVHVIIDESAEATGQTEKPGLRDAIESLPTPAETPSNNQSENDRGSIHRHFFPATANGVDPDVSHKKGKERNNESAEESVHEEDHEDFYEPQETKQTKHVSNDRVASGSRIHNEFKPVITSNAAVPSSSDDLIPQVKEEIVVLPVPSLVQEPPRRDQSLRARTEASELPASDDPRFEIAITAPDSSLAHFKTRGKHPVRKVLAAACKTFGIKYERAHLVLVLTFEEDGGMQTHHMVCPPEDTMSKCGVNSESKLFIKIDEDDENGDSDWSAAR